jgi:hypothetical protein
MLVLEGKAAILELQALLTNKGYYERHLNHYLNTLINKLKIIKDVDHSAERKAISP